MSWCIYASILTPHFARFLHKLINYSLIIISPYLLSQYTQYRPYTNHAKPSITFIFHIHFRQNRHFSKLANFEAIFSGEGGETGKK